MKATEEAHVSVTGSVAVLELRRPRVLNALVPPVLDAMIESMRGLSSRDDVNGLVITGAGRGFCAGADIEYQSRASRDQYANFISSIQDLTTAIRESDLLVVAAINGLAMGGGLELALACDRRIALPGVQLGLPEVHLGLTVTSGVNHILPRLVGQSRALELLTSGRSISAEEGLQLGLIDELSDEPLETGKQIVAALRTPGPGTIQRLKRALYAGTENTMRSTLDLEKELILESFDQGVTQQRLRSFKENNRQRKEGIAGNGEIDGLEQIESV